MPDFEISAQDAMNIVRPYPDQGGQEQAVVGIITDQDQATAFLEWLFNDEAGEIGRQIREQ